MSELVRRDAPSVLAVDDQPSAGRPAESTAAAALGGLAALIVVAAGAAVGFWFAPFGVGVASGLVFRRLRLRKVLPVTAAASGLGWAVPLAWLAARGEPVGATARTVAALAGLPASGALVIGVTLLIAALQAIAGLWLARALAPWVKRPA